MNPESASAGSSAERAGERNEQRTLPSRHAVCASARHSDGHEAEAPALNQQRAPLRAISIEDAPTAEQALRVYGDRHAAIL